MFYDKSEEHTCSISLLGVLFWAMLNFHFFRFIPAYALLASILLKLSKHEKATHPLEFFISWGNRSHFLLLPADSDSTVDCLSAFIFYYGCALLSFSIIRRYLSEM